MIKLFTFGVVLGLAASVGVLYAFPAVDLERESSIVSVQPNGGTRERFQVALPADRLMAGRGGRSSYPTDMLWPETLASLPADVELFKVRDEQSRVVGIGSRLVVRGDAPYVEWALHLPARGTMYLNIDGRPAAEGGRRGTLRGGTREFLGRSGFAGERFLSAEGKDAGEGILELVTITIAEAEQSATERMEEAAQ